MMMLRVIAEESKTSLEYAKRAEAYNSTLAAPCSDAELARYYPPPMFNNTGKRSNPDRRVMALIREARTEREKLRAHMFENLIKTAR